MLFFLCYLIQCTLIGAALTITVLRVARKTATAGRSVKRGTLWLLVCIGAAIKRRYGGGQMTSTASNPWRPVERESPSRTDVLERKAKDAAMAQQLLGSLSFGLLVASTLLFKHALSGEQYSRSSAEPGKDFFIGPCLVNTNQTCPDPEVSFFLFTRRNLRLAQRILVSATGSNLDDTFFNPEFPTKIIVHGYNSDMELDSLIDIRTEYLKKGRSNLIAVDWRRLAAGPCYPVAVHNVPHVGECVAQLIDRLKDHGAKDIHVIGFSLGAHVPAFSANFLKPYKLPRITGLDPAMPFFITVSTDQKLDSSDAEFVDVIHTNAFVQGKVETIGHIDFYMNGGVTQPGCWEKRNPFGCDHHRAAIYFAESINSQVGFWGWPCSGFFAYLIGLCPPRFPAVLSGDPVDKNYKGYFLVKTKDKSPFAQGIFTVDPPSVSDV